jgi:hypothetical protein
MGIFSPLGLSNEDFASKAAKAGLTERQVAGIVGQATAEGAFLPPPRFRAQNDAPAAAGSPLVTLLLVAVVIGGAAFAVEHYS